MIKPDCIVAWPRNCDYPLWRQFIRDNRERFNLVIVVFTETHQGEDYRDFVRDAMAKDWVQFVDIQQTPAGADWRNVAVNAALLHSYNAEWVWFTEQDFFIYDVDAFFKVADEVASNGAEWIGVYDGPRLHPCCIMIKRPLLNRLDKNFGALPPKYDHFGYIQTQLEQSPKLGASFNEGWHHMAGLSHNMRLVVEGGYPNYKPEEFDRYIEKCLNVTVPIDPRFTFWVMEYIKRRSGTIID